MSASWADIYHGLKRHVNGKPLDVMSGTVQYGYASVGLQSIPPTHAAFLYLVRIKFQRQGFKQGLLTEVETREVWE